MLRVMCKSKIHRATITKKDLDYGGSIGIDKALLEASNILPNELVQVVNLNNGARFETYVIEEPKNSGVIALYGPATYQGQIGDLVIIISYCLIEEKETRSVTSKVVLVDEKNRVIKKK
jgi:aspartate 1-decarboxylase